MRKIAIALACLSCAGHGRQVDISTKSKLSEPLLESRALTTLEAFTTFLLALHPSAALNTRRRLSAVNPILISSTSAVKPVGDRARTLQRLRGGVSRSTAVSGLTEISNKYIASKKASKSVLVGSVSSKLKPMKDKAITTVACLGAGRSASPVICESLGFQAEKSKVHLVDGPAPLVLLDAASASDSERAMAVATADVLVLEVHFDDLVRSTVHGLAQLLPALKQSAKLPSPRPPPKVLLLTITNYAASEASEADVTAFAEEQLKQLMASLSESTGHPAADLLQLQCVFVPRKSLSPQAYDTSLSTLNATLMSTAEGAAVNFSAPASSVVTSMQKAESALASAFPLKKIATPAEAHVAYQCSLFAEGAAREFQKRLIDLRKAAAEELVVDFGASASKCIEEALTQFDSDSVAFKGTREAAAARSSLAEQLQRALYGPFRKQIAVLQQLTLANFLSKLVATKAVADIEMRLRGLVKKAMADFDASAKRLLPSDLHWSFAYERAAVQESMREAAREHVEKLQIQGLCISKAKARMPVDFSAHWLLPHPFGRDSRYEPLSGDLSDYNPREDDILTMKKLDQFKARAERLDKRLLKGFSSEPELSKESNPKEMIYEAPPKEVY